MLGLYFILYFLNIFWFITMVKGSYLFLQNQKKLRDQVKYQVQVEFSTEQHTEDLESDRSGRRSDLQNDSIAAV